jgi:hypothetical protein
MEKDTHKHAETPDCLPDQATQHKEAKRTMVHPENSNTLVRDEASAPLERWYDTDTS